MLKRYESCYSHYVVSDRATAFVLSRKKYEESMENHGIYRALLGWGDTCVATPSSDRVCHVRALERRERPPG